MEVLKLRGSEVASRSRPISLLAALTAASLTAMSPPAIAGPGGPVWTMLRPAVSPPARAAQAMAYDLAARNVVVFGGYDAVGYRNDTWTWDGSTWTRANPSIDPPVRAGAGLAYDMVTKQLVLFGGYDGTRDLGDTWTWDGQPRSWTEQHPATHPKAVTGPMLFTDPISGHVDMIGGFDGIFFHAETWQWTGSDWKRLLPQTSPYARGSGIAALDRRSRTVVLFGGIGDLNTYNTWTWDGANWTLQSPAQQPPQRFYSAADYYPGARGVVLFGGGSGEGDLADTWVWTGTDWVQVTMTTLPLPRESLGLAFDGDTGQLLLFAGSARGALENDTWSL